MQKLFTVGLIAILVIGLITSVPLTGTFAKSNKDKKARDAIIKAIGKATEGKYSSIKLVAISKSNVTGFIIAYNNTKSVTPPPPPPPNCNPDEHLENGKCVPNPVPPVPTGQTTKACFLGDFKDDSVVKKMTDCNVKVALGDMGYGSNINLLKSLNFDKCVIGNHDATEDGSKALYQEALAYCGDHWSQKIANNTVLILGFNTNGDVSTELSAAKASLSDTKNMQNVKTVIIVSHKGGHVPPNSHHPAEAKGLYQQIEQSVPSSVKLIEIYGHNHVSSSAPSKNWYQAGAGGKSHYECGTDAIWTFCDNTHYGYLQLTVDNKNGTTMAKFVN